MNFAVAYSEIGKFLEYRDVNQMQNIYLQKSIGHLVETGNRLLISNRNTSGWYSDATDFLLNLCVVGNIKGLIVSPVDHEANDGIIINRAPSVIVKQIQQNKLSFGHLAYPARSIYRLAPEETRLNYELDKSLNESISRIKASKLISVNVDKFKQGLKAKSKRLLVRA